MLLYGVVPIHLIENSMDILYIEFIGDSYTTTSTTL